MAMEVGSAMKLPNCTALRQIWKVRTGELIRFTGAAAVSGTAHVATVVPASKPGDSGDLSTWVENIRKPHGPYKKGAS